MEINGADEYHDFIGSNVQRSSDYSSQQEAEQNLQVSKNQNKYRSWKKHKSSNRELTVIGAK